MGESFTCARCGRSMIISYEMQHSYRERKKSLPRYCEECWSRIKYENDSGNRGTYGPPDEPLFPRRATYDNPFLPRRSGREALLRLLRSWWSEPLYRYGTLTLGLSLGLAATIWYFGHPLTELKSWLIAVNLVALAAYGYDKVIAGSSWTRIPESVLLMLAFLGGSPAALIGMWLFRHKTTKESFRLRFWLVVLAQVAIVAVYYFGIKPFLGH